MQAKEVIAKLSKLYTQQQSLDEDIKSVKEEAKESGLDAAVLAKVAKAVVYNKVDDLKEVSELILDTIEVARS